MKLGKFRQSKFGLTTALCVMTTVVLIDMAGTFAPFNAMFENACHRIGIPRARASNVLTVCATPEFLAAGSQDLVGLLDEIHRHSPKAIGLVVSAEPSNYQKLDRLPYSRELTVGYAADQLFSNPGGKVSSSYKSGFSNLPENVTPVFRKGRAMMEQVGVRLPSLEGKIVESLRGSAYLPPENEFVVTWCGGPGTIGRINATELVNGSSVRELIQGKIVLIGPDHEEAYGVHVPSKAGIARMHRLEVRANIIESLLQDKYSGHLPVVLGFVLAICATLVTIQLARQTPLGWCLCGGGIVIAVMLLASVCSIWMFRVWLPVSMLTAAVALAYAAITVQRFDTMENFVQYWKMRSTVREAHLESRFEEGVWKAIGDSAYQMFQPTRMVLLELNPGATHLKNVRSIGCDYSHIFEKRLDYRRSPYFEALEDKRPIVNPRGNYFIAMPGVKEVEYVLPMTNGATTLGIIVLGMDEKKLAQWADFESFLGRFSHEMSQLIAGSRKEAQENLEHLNWIQRLQRLPEEREFIEIQRNTEKQNDLIERADLAFDCSESALATFDIYGRVIRRNSSFNRMIQEAQLSISSASCIEIMATLSGRSQNACRKIYRQVILDDHPETIMIVSSVPGRNPKVMYVKPMHLVEEERRTSIEMHGLLIEVVDGAPFENLDLWNQQLATTLVPQASEKSHALEANREKIRAIGEAAQSPQEALQDLFGSVGNTVDDIVSVLQQCKEMTQRRVSEDVGNCFPVDAISIWKSVVSNFEEALANRSIRIKTGFGSDSVMVSANPLLLDKVFATAVQFLVDNAFDDSEVRVNFSQGPTGVSCLFINEGGGTPIETLRRSLQANEGTADSSGSENADGTIGQNLTAAQTDQLAEIEGWVASWGGAVSVVSQPHCMSVTIDLISCPIERAKPHLELSAAKVEETGTRSEA
jgi:CHASE2 domain-containing sensor protein